MPNRDVHNKIAKFFFPYISMKVINEVNMLMDEPSQWMGSHHRVVFHSANPGKKDSLQITHGDPDRELVRQLHILVDYDKDVRRMLRLAGIIPDND